MENPSMIAFTVPVPSFPPRLANESIHLSNRPSDKNAHDWVQMDMSNLCEVISEWKAQNFSICKKYFSNRSAQ